MPQVGLILCLFLLTGTSSSFAQERPLPPSKQVSDAKIAAFNIVLTGATATVRQWAEGNLDGWKDALTTFLYGGGAGYGFYQAKRLVGNGHGTAGLALAYLSTSVIENASRGRHPLAYLRVGPGPLDLLVRTPFAQTSNGSPIAIEVNAVSTLGLVILPVLGYQPFFRSGTVFYRSDDLMGRGERPHYYRGGLTIGRTIILSPVANQDVVGHETIHLIQALQVGATTPYYRLSSIFSGINPAIDVGPIEVSWDVQVDWLYGMLAGLSLLANYENRWVEIEAYSLSHTPEQCWVPCIALQ